MTRTWGPLPDSLAPEIAYLVGVLRELKDRADLSLTELANRTPYSKSSWSRYLAGTAFPPRHAVEALAQLVGEPRERLLALWERAEAQWSGRAVQTRPATARPHPGPSDTTREPAGRLHAGHWRTRIVYLSIATCSALATLVIVGFSLGVVGPEASPPTSALPTYSVGCRGIQCTARDPQDMACALDAASFADLQVGDAYLELRISDQCGAAWARISHTTVGDRVQVVDRSGATETTAIADATTTVRYIPTRMVAAHQHSDVRACWESVTGLRRCTPWGAAGPVHPPGSSGPA